jgi:hypothetical protein
VSFVLTNTPAEIMREQMISGSGALFDDPNATNPTWPLYVSELPDGTGIPDNAAAVYDTEGVIFSRLLASGRVLQGYGIQIKIRGRTYSQAYSLLYTTASALAKLKNVPVSIDGNNYAIETFRQTSGVISMGQDEKRRALCSLNGILSLIETV